MLPSILESKFLRVLSIVSSYVKSKCWALKFIIIFIIIFNIIIIIIIIIINVDL